MKLQASMGSVLRNRRKPKQSDFKTCTGVIWPGYDMYNIIYLFLVKYRIRLFRASLESIHMSKIVVLSTSCLMLLLIRI